MTDPTKRPLQRHRVPRSFAVAPLIPDPLSEGWSEWDNYTVGKYGRSNKTLAQALPVGVDYRTLDDFPELPDWALTAFQAVGHVRGVGTSVLVYRTSDKHVSTMAYAEIYAQRCINLRLDFRLNDPERSNKSRERNTYWGARALAYHGIFIDMYFDESNFPYDYVIEQLWFHDVDIFYRHDLRPKKKDSQESLFNGKY